MTKANYKKKLPKYYKGVDLTKTLGITSGITGGLLDNYTQQTTTDADGREYKTQDDFAAFGSGALKGAAAGAALGPWGAAGGALIYGTASLFTNQANTDRVNKAKAEALTRRNELAYDNAVNNQQVAEAQGFRKQGQQYVSMYKKGGYIKYDKGGETPKSIQDFNRKYKTNYRDVAEFTTKSTPDKNSYNEVDPWLANWISNPITVKKFTKQGYYDGDIINYSSTPKYNKHVIKQSLQRLATTPLKENTTLPANILGVTRSRNDFPYKVEVASLKDKGTIAHEGVHVINKFSDKINSEIYVRYPQKENTTKIFPTSKIGRTLLKGTSSYLEEDGMYPRIMDIRRTLNMKPGQPFNKEDLDKPEIQKPLYDLQQYYDNDVIIQMLNELASNNKNKVLPIAAYGGNIGAEYEVEGNEVVQGVDTQLEGQEQLASDMHKAVGPSHEDGGVLGQGGDRVFSDRLVASPYLTSALSALKIRTGKTATYASIAEKLGKLKGKYEDKTQSNNPITNNTGKAMLGRIEGLIDAAFEDQEMQKESNPALKFANGGTLPDWNQLGEESYVPDNSPVRTSNSTNIFVPREIKSQESIKQEIVKEVVNNPTFDVLKYKPTRIKTLEPDSNAVKAVNFFVDKGLSKESAVGIVGNLYHESGGLNPNITETKKDGTKGPGYGIAQWTTPDRKKGLDDYAKSQGKDKSDILLQLEYLYKEMSEGKIAGRDVTKEFKKLTDIDKATYLFEATMERAKIKNMSARIDYAKDLYKLIYGQTDNKPKYAMGGRIKKYYGGGDIETLRKMYPNWSGSDEDLYKLAVSKGYKGNGNVPEEDLPKGNPYNNIEFNSIPTKPAPYLPVKNNKLSYPDTNKVNSYTKPKSRELISVQGNNPEDGTWKENKVPFTNSTDKAKLFDFTGGNTSVDNYSPSKSSAKRDYSDINKFVNPEQAINTMVYLSNLKRGDKQQTGFMPEVAAPAYMRNVNMLPYNKYMISKEAETMGRNIDMSSGNTQDRFARRMAVKGEAMDRINAATASQAERDMAVNNTNTQISNEYRGRKAEAKNKYLEMKTMGENAKLTNKQAATNAWLQGIMANLATGRAYEVEKEKMQIARMDGGRGTAERSDSNLEFIKDYLPRRKKGGYIKK